MTAQIFINDSWQPLFNSVNHNVEQCLRHWSSIRGFTKIRVTNEAHRVLFEGDARNFNANVLKDK